MTFSCRFLLVAMITSVTATSVAHNGESSFHGDAGTAIATEAASCCVVEQSPASDPVEKSTPQQNPTTSSKIDVPKGVDIYGVVTVKGHWDLHKPDLTRGVVYLASDTTLDAVPTGVEFVTVAQKNKSFVPQFTVIPRGTTVEFPNWDDFDHNVFSRSAAAPAFDLDRYPKGQSKSRVFEKVGVVQIFCNIHPQMRAIVFVTPNRYFAQCDAEGRFTIHDVPPGKYQIVAWQERCGETRQAIEVASRGGLEVSLTLEENRDAIMSRQPAKREKAYGVDRGLGVKREKLNLPVVGDSHPAKTEPPQ